MKISADHKMEFNLAERIISFRDIARILFRHQWKIIFFFFLTIVPVIITTLLQSDIYRSESKLLIRVGEQNEPITPRLLGTESSNVRETIGNITNTEISILTSRIILENVVKKFTPQVILGLEANPPSGEQPWSDIILSGQGIKSDDDIENQPADAFQTSTSLNDQAVNTLGSNLKVDNVPGNSLIGLSIDSHDPQLAHDVLSSLIDFYLERHIAVRQEQISPQIIRSQAEKLEQNLNDKENRMQVFRDEYGVLDLEVQKKMLLNQIQSLSDRIVEANADILASQAKMKSLDKSLEDLPETRVLQQTVGDDNPVIDDIQKRLVALRLEETDLAGRYPSDARPLTDIRERIRTAEKTLGQQKQSRKNVTTGLDNNHQRLRLELEIERAQVEALQSKVNSLQMILLEKEAFLADLVDQEIILDSMEREIRIAETSYLQFNENLQRTEIASALKSSNYSSVSILQPATLNLQPVTADKKRNILLAIALGLFGGIGMAFILNYLDDSLKSSEEVVRKLGLPVLGTLSEKEYQQCI